MPTFEFKALDADGKECKGVLEAHSKHQVRQLLRNKRWAPLLVKRRDKQTAQAQDKELFHFSQRISQLALTLITRQMATLTQAGLPIEVVLQTIAKQSASLKINAFLLSVRADVLEGHTLADALGNFPQIFDNQYRMTVAAGEHTGRLGDVLENLATYTEKKQKFQQEVQAALLYPIILLGMALVIVTALVIYVVPQVASVFDDRSSELPWLTQALISFSSFMQAYLVWLIVILGLMALGAIRLLRMPTVRKSWHQLLLDTPVIGQFVRESDIARFTSTMAILVQSSTPLLEALKVAGATLNNLVLRAAVSEVTVRVSEGENLAGALQGVGYFPPLLLQMVSSGESSGKLAQMLIAAADYQEQAFVRKTTTLVKLFEPAMLVVMGLVVMLIVLAVLLPILQFNQLVS